MNEHDYRIQKLKSIFELNYDKNIAIYGTGASVNMIFDEFPDIDIVGLMDAKKEGEFYQGHYIMSENDALLMGIEVLLIPARFDSAVAVFKRVSAFCFNHNIMVLDIFGNDMTQVYGGVLKHLCSYSKLKNDDFARLLNSYDTISISMRDALSFVEGSRIVPRIWMVNAVNDAIEQGKRLIIISDYELSKAECRDLLSEWGIEGDCSCVIEQKDGLSVYDGLFCEVCELSVGRLLHIGCDFVRDGYIPKAYGHDSFIIKNDTELFGDPFRHVDERRREYPNRNKRLQELSRVLIDCFNEYVWKIDEKKQDAHKSILVIFSHVPQYDKYGGDRTVYCYLKLFVKMGMEVTFIPADFIRITDYEKQLETLGIKVLSGDFYRMHWPEWLVVYGERFDFVFTQLPMETSKFKGALKAYCTNARILYCEHELAFIRKEREFETTGRNEYKREAERFKDILADNVSTADAVYVLSTYERDILVKLFPDKSIKEIPVYLYDEPPVKVKSEFNKRKDILIVAHVDFIQNLDGILWFKENVFPVLVERYPEICWNIVGKVSDENRKKLEGDNIIVHGWLPEEKLDKLYRSSRLEVVPIRFGSGVKGKIIEAAYNGLPVVATSVGAEAIPLECGNICVADGEDGMAESIVALYEDYERLADMSAATEIFIKNYYMADVAEEVLMEEFGL